MAKVLPLTSKRPVASGPVTAGAEPPRAPVNVCRLPAADVAVVAVLIVAEVVVLAAETVVVEAIEAVVLVSTTEAVVVVSPPAARAPEPASPVPEAVPSAVTVNYSNDQIDQKQLFQFGKRRIRASTHIGHIIHMAMLSNRGKTTRKSCKLTSSYPDRKTQSTHTGWWLAQVLIDAMR